MRFEKRKWVALKKNGERGVFQRESQSILLSFVLTLTKQPKSKNRATLLGQINYKSSISGVMSK